MWYRKNVGGWERAARLIGGGLMPICGVVAQRCTLRRSGYCSAARVS